MGGFTKALPASELGPGEARCVELAGRRIAIFNVEGRYHAIDDECTHTGGPLSEGDLEGGEVVCPWHGACFDVATGEVKEGPADEDVATYPVRVSEGYVEIEV